MIVTVSSQDARKLNQELREITAFLEKLIFPLFSVWHITGTQYMFVELDPGSGSTTREIFDVSRKEILYL